MNAVELFWTGHTVRDEPFSSSSESLRYLDWRSSVYPLFLELMGLWDIGRDRIVLDYGCGPGNDTVGFLVHGGAKEVIGMDVSGTALELARRRLALHDIKQPYSFWKVSDEEPILPRRDASVDLVYCEGVLHHVSHPEEILAEFHRVLRSGGEARIMVYNYDSLWVHRYVAYERRIVQGIDRDLPFEEAFRRSTDGGECPISRAYRPTEFIGLCEEAGFEAEFLGGYFNGASELALPRDVPPDLPEEHRDFLDALTDEPYPRYNDLPAGIGGAYRLRR